MDIINCKQDSDGLPSIGIKRTPDNRFNIRLYQDVSFVWPIGNITVDSVVTTTNKIKFSGGEMKFKRLVIYD